MGSSWWRHFGWNHSPIYNCYWSCPVVHLQCYVVPCSYYNYHILPLLCVVLSVLRWYVLDTSRSSLRVKSASYNSRWGPNCWCSVAAGVSCEVGGIAKNQFKTVLVRNICFWRATIISSMLLWCAQYNPKMRCLQYSKVVLGAKTSRRIFPQLYSEAPSAPCSFAHYRARNSCTRLPAIHPRCCWDSSDVVNLAGVKLLMLQRLWVL